MCYSCWVEAGSPTELPENADELFDLIKRFYAVAPMGGILHIVTDDMNVKDENIEWALTRVAVHRHRTRTSVEEIELGVKLGLELYRLPEDQRMALLWKYWNEEVLK
jgi:hypothetical protein